MAKKSRPESAARLADSRFGGKLGRTGVAALSMAGVCKALPVSTAKPPPGQHLVAQAPAASAERHVFYAKDALGFVPQPKVKGTRDGALFTLAKLSAFQKPPMEEELIEPPGASAGTCSCNTVCSCVPVQSCSCNSVCTCDTVSSCAAYSSGGGGGGGGYGGYYAPCW